MNTLLPLLAVMAFALVVFFGGEHSPAHTPARTQGNTQLAQAMPETKGTFPDKPHERTLKKKHSHNDDFRHLNN